MEWMNYKTVDDDFWGFGGQEEEILEDIDDSIWANW
jgi:hypothetical protein